MATAISTFSPAVKEIMEKHAKGIGEDGENLTSFMKQALDADTDAKKNIWTHKSVTRRFIQTYYTKKHNWNTYHMRLRQDLTKYMKNDDAKYMDQSAPLKAYLEWNLKERSEIKSCNIEWTYSPEKFKEVMEYNKRANDKIKDLEARAKPAVEMVDASTNTSTLAYNLWEKYQSVKMVDCETMTDDCKIDNNVYESSDFSCQTDRYEPDEYDLTNELLQKYDELKKYVKVSAGKKRLNLKNVIAMAGVVTDPDDNDKLFKVIQATCNRKC